MKIDTAIRDFSERYDREAMQSIDRLSHDFGLSHSKQTIKVFNIEECFQSFNEYLKGYSEYKIKNLNNEKASPREVIQESVQKFIDTGLVNESNIRYPELPNFVKSYINGVNMVANTVDGIKDTLMNEGVSYDDIGDINDYTDKFMEKVDGLFHEAMNRILWASGYNSHKKNISPISPIHEKVDFI